MDKNDPGAVLIPFSGVFENKLLDMDDAERAKYSEENKVTRWAKLSTICCPTDYGFLCNTIKH